MHVRSAACLVALAALAAPTVAAARPAEPDRLWATVNVCDTVGHPDSIGIRGSMPGSGDRAETMFIRFQVQYYTPADRTWHDLDEADSGFVELGSAKSRTRQFGQTFTITPPRPGTTPYLMRGVVTFEWRHDDEVARRARKRTTAGHPGTKGSDPPRFSAATCTIS